MFQGFIQLLSTPALAWWLVVVATLCETIWFVLLKKSGGLEVWPWNLLSYFIILIDVPLLAIALKTLPLGSVYAFWTGASAVAIALIGIFFFTEVATFWKLLFITLTIIGLIGDKFDELVTMACEHIITADDSTPAKTPEGCEECLQTGDTWVHLRLCLTCGHVGCCDSSKNKHATKHFHATNHPVVKSFQPGEEWKWCYLDEVMAQ